MSTTMTLVPSAGHLFLHFGELRYFQDTGARTQVVRCGKLPAMLGMSLLVLS